MAFYSKPCRNIAEHCVFDDSHQILTWVFCAGLRQLSESFTCPDLTASYISYRYFWSVLESLQMSPRDLDDITSNSTIGLYATSKSCFPRGPLKLLGPIVTPSKDLTRCINGSSFICNKQMHHCRGRLIFASKSVITPPFSPTFTFAPSHPIT